MTVDAIATPGPEMIRMKRRIPWPTLALMAPLLLLMIFTFVVPMGMLLWRTVAEPELGQTLPHTQAMLKTWSGEGMPPDPVWQQLSQELRQASTASVAALGRRLTYDTPGMRPLLLKTRTQLLQQPEAGDRAALVAISPRWEDPAVWQTLKRAAGPVSSFYLLNALDLRYDYQHGIENRPEEGLYRSILQRTFAIALMTTLFCLLLALPLCATIVRLSERGRKHMMILILLPFWTSILVRTTAWMVLLQDKGIINDFLIATGVTSSPLHMLYNRFGVMVALVHVMLPFMIFPLLASMSAVDHRLTRAASSLGAGPLTVFWRVWLPQVMPGLVAGMLMVFIVTLGFYITPALIGGPADQMISYYIALFTTGTMNWGLASALGIVLTVITCLFYLLQRMITDRTAQGGLA